MMQSQSPNNPAPTQKQRGFALLITASTLLLLMLILSVIAVRSTIVEQRVVNSEYNLDQAFEAAEAGLQFGIVNLSATGSLAPILNVALANNAQYSINYSQPDAINKPNLILITVTGTSADATTRRNVQQQVNL